jgi:hypothetical protein
MTREFYEVHGTEWFLPVRLVSLSDRSAEIKYTDIYGQTHCEVVPEIYKFKKETEKPEIPWFVAEHIEHHKRLNSPMGDIFNRHFIDDKRVEAWLREALNAYDNLGKAWLFGYKIKKDKVYIVTDGNHCYFESWDDARAIVILDDMIGYEDCAKKFDSKTEAEKVAEQLGWKVETKEVG